MSKKSDIFSLADNLPEEEKESILVSGSLLLLPKLENRITLAKCKIEQFQKKYQTTLEQLSTLGLPDDADYIQHEDYIEWKHWNDVIEQTRKTIYDIRAILEATNARENTSIKNFLDL